MIKVTLTK